MMIWTDQDDDVAHEQDRRDDQTRMRMIAYVALAVALAFATSCGVAVGLRMFS